MLPGLVIRIGGLVLWAVLGVGVGVDLDHGVVVAELPLPRLPGLMLAWLLMPLVFPVLPMMPMPMTLMRAEGDDHDVNGNGSWRVSLPGGVG